MVQARRDVMSRPRTLSIRRLTCIPCKYAKFWEDPDRIPMEWLALLLMVLALGVFFSIYAAPREVQSPDGRPPIDLYRAYRALAGRGWRVMLPRSQT